MKQIKLIIPMLAFAVALVSAFAFNTKRPTDLISYHYIGAYTDTEVKKPANWIVETTECPAIGNLPCAIETDLERPDFDLMVQGFSSVSAATTAANKRTED